jgi:hypothetical protein
MAWPAYYGVWLAILHLTIRHLRPWRAALVLAIALSIQVVDLSPSYLSMRERYVTPRVWRSPLRNPFWATAVHKYRRIAVVPSGFPFPYAPIALIASSNGMATNAASLARYPTGEMIDRISDARTRALRTNQLDPDTLYIVPPEDYFLDVTRNLTGEHGVGRIDGYNVIAPYWFADPRSAGVGSIQRGAAR